MVYVTSAFWQAADPGWAEKLGAAPSIPVKIELVPVKVAPVEQQFDVPSAEFTFALSANSLTVLRVGVAGK